MAAAQSVLKSLLVTLPFAFKKSSRLVVLVPRMHRGLLDTLQYARSLNLPMMSALHVNIDPEASPGIRQEWERCGQNVPLVILESPFRSIVEPILEYVDEMQREFPSDMIAVIVPEFVPGRWWHPFLHNNIAAQLRRALGNRRNIVITNVRY